MVESASFFIVKKIMNDIKTKWILVTPRREKIDTLWVKKKWINATKKHARFPAERQDPF